MVLWNRVHLSLEMCRISSGKGGGEGLRAGRESQMGLRAGRKCQMNKFPLTQLSDLGKGVSFWKANDRFQRTSASLETIKADSFEKRSVKADQEFP